MKRFPRALALVGLSLALAACGAPPAPSAVPVTPNLAAQAIGGTNIDAWRSQVIYLVMPDRFSNGSTANDGLGQANCLDPASGTKFHGGDLAGLRSKLSYIKGLGATAVWITPVYQQVGLVNGNSCGYHGYWPNFKATDDRAIEPKFGTASDLTGLVTDLHNNGMKFILDMVVNHAGYNAAVVAQQPGWFHDPSTCSSLGDPTVTCPLAGLPDFRQEDGTVAAYLTNISKRWTADFALDGIRMDTVKHVPTSYWQNSWVPGVLATRPNTFLLGEAFLDANASQLRPFLDAGFDSTFNFPLRRALVNVFAKGGSTDELAGSVQDTVGTLGLDRALLQVNLLDNHDVPRFTNEPGFGVAEDEIRRRLHLGLGALFTLPGIPQLYYGNELGMYGGADPDNRRDMPSWAWTSTGRAGTYGGFIPNPSLTYTLVQKLAGLRKNNPALYKGVYAEMWRQNGGANVFAFYRGSGTNRVVVVFNNGTLPSGNIPLNISGNGAIPATDRSALANATFDDLMGGGVVTASNGTLNVNVAGKAFAIYRAR